MNTAALEEWLETDPPLTEVVAYKEELTSWFKDCNNGNERYQNGQIGAIDRYIVAEVERVSTIPVRKSMDEQAQSTTIHDSE
jgi:hypothetical protein